MAEKRAKFLFLMTILLTTAASANVEVYHWVDENGVVNYSQEPPPSSVPGVEKLVLEDSTPTQPAEDLYDIEGQAKRMNALREEMKERRDAASERKWRESQRTVVQYRDPYPRYYRRSWYAPIRPRPPQRPQPPVARPPGKVALIPPGRSGN